MSPFSYSNTCLSIFKNDYSFFKRWVLQCCTRQQVSCKQFGMFHHCDLLIFLHLYAPVILFLSPQKKRMQLNYRNISNFVLLWNIVSPFCQKLQLWCYLQHLELSRQYILYSTLLCQFDDSISLSVRLWHRNDINLNFFQILLFDELYC